MRSKSEQQSVQVPGWAPSGSNSLFVTIRDSQSLSLGENLVTSHSFEMRKLFFSCLTSEQGDLRKGCESYWGFTSRWGVIHSQHCSDVPFNPLTPEPEWLGHLLPTSGGRAPVLPLMQSLPLKLPFLQRLAWTLQLHLPRSHATSLHGAEGKQRKLRCDPKWGLSSWGSPVSMQRWEEHKWEGTAMGNHLPVALGAS